MNLLLYSSLLLYLVLASNAELSRTCEGNHNRFKNCVYRETGVKRTERLRNLRNDVNTCFSTAKCDRPNFGADILPGKIKDKMVNNARTMDYHLYYCVGNKLHDTQVDLLSECRKKGTGKTAKDIMNIKAKLHERLDYLFDAMAIVKAKTDCPAGGAGLDNCIKKAMDNILDSTCANIEKKCARDIERSNCRPQYENMKDEVCKCRDEVRAARLLPKRMNPGGSGVSALTTGTGTGSAIPNLFTNLLNRLGASSILRPLLRLKRQLPTTTTAAKGLGSIVNLFKGLQLPVSEPNLNEFGAAFALNTNEVNNTLIDCRRKSEAFPDTPEKSLLLACGCPLKQAAGKRLECMASGECIGNSNYKVFNDAVNMVKRISVDHLRYFCDCTFVDPK